MAAGHLISRITILGTGLIGGSFALALRKYTTGIHISGWDHPEVVREAQARGALDEAFCAELAPALKNADLIYLALPIAATIDLLPEIARHAPSHALVTDACSTTVPIPQAAAELFSGEKARSSLAAILWLEGNCLGLRMRTPTFSAKTLTP